MMFERLTTWRFCHIPISSERSILRMMMLSQEGGNGDYFFRIFQKNCIIWLGMFQAHNVCCRRFYTMKIPL